MKFIRKYPVRTYGLAVALFQAATEFGVSLTGEQQTAALAVFAAVISLLAENFTVPTSGPVSPDS